MCTTNYVHDASPMQTALDGTCQTNKQRKNPQRYPESSLLENAILGVSNYAIEMFSSET